MLRTISKYVKCVGYKRPQLGASSRTIGAIDDTTCVPAVSSIFTNPGRKQTAGSVSTIRHLPSMTLSASSGNLPSKLRSRTYGMCRFAAAWCAANDKMLQVPLVSTLSRCYDNGWSALDCASGILSVTHATKFRHIRELPLY